MTRSSTKRSIFCGPLWRQKARPASVERREGSMRIAAAVLFGILLLGGLLLGGLESPARVLSKEATKTPSHRPAALVLADAGSWLFVANRRSGSITVIRPPNLDRTG